MGRYFIGNCGGITQKAVYEYIRKQKEENDSSRNQKWIWKIAAFLKVQILMQEALQNTLPIRANMARRGMQVNSNYLMCNRDEEAIEHLFMQCPFAKGIWRNLNASREFQNSFNLDLYEWIKQLQSDNKGLEQLQHDMVVYICVFLIGQCA